MWSSEHNFQKDSLKRIITAKQPYFSCIPNPHRQIGHCNYFPEACQGLRVLLFFPLSLFLRTLFQVMVPFISYPMFSILIIIITNINSDLKRSRHSSNCCIGIINTTTLHDRHLLLLLNIIIYILHKYENWGTESSTKGQMSHS